jgi:hypothetical protein
VGDSLLRFSLFYSRYWIFFVFLDQTALFLSVFPCPAEVSREFFSASSPIWLGFLLLCESIFGVLVSGTGLLLRLQFIPFYVNIWSERSGAEEGHRPSAPFVARALRSLRRRWPIRHHRLSHGLVFDFILVSIDSL